MNLDRVLGTYCGVGWVPLPLEPPATLYWADGTSSGIVCCAFSVPGKPPRYRERDAPKDQLDAVAFRFVDERTHGRLIIAPGIASLDDALVDRLADCDALLVDGTFWDEYELDEVTGRPTSTPASGMGHLPVGGNGGSLGRLAKLPVSRKMYIHINNTNPMILEDSMERREVEAAGFGVGYDGLHFVL